MQNWMKRPPSSLNLTCWVFTPVSYLRRTPGCWAPSSCGSCLSSRWQIWGGSSSVGEGWTPGSGTLRGRKRMYHTLCELFVRKYACEASCDGRSYSRWDTSVCVFSMMTGLGGGVNLGGRPLPPPAAWRQRDVDRNPGNKKVKHHPCCCSWSRRRMWLLAACANSISDIGSYLSVLKSLKRILKIYERQENLLGLLTFMLELRVP